jgi:aminoglycoside phosphotransferase (APT) family kinase protein
MQNELTNIPAEIRHWAEKHIGTIKAARRLKGGISTSILRLTTAQNDYVLRIIDRADWLAIEPDLAPHEAAALEHAAKLNVPTPCLIAFDNAEVCPIPTVLSEYMPGQLVLMPANLDTWLQALAVTLAKIHEIDAPDFLWHYQSWVVEAKIATPPAWTSQPELWQKAYSILHQTPPDTPIRFIHRDYHPANVLFAGDRLTAVVDWINACRGSACVDVAICRNDLVALHGLDAANKFQAYYEAASGIKHHPYWDLHTFMDFFSIDLDKVLASWRELGLSHLHETVLYQRADEFLVDIMRRL